MRAATRCSPATSRREIRKKHESNRPGAAGIYLLIVPYLPTSSLIVVFFLAYHWGCDSAASQPTPDPGRENVARA